jgi:hypothetical protein
VNRVCISFKKPEQTFLCALSLLTFIEITKQLFKGHEDELKVALYLLTFKERIASLTFSERCYERMFAKHSVYSEGC